ncbi:helix-turn-helix domain-containing protein [Zooshikella ganghwensis]|uniref:Helix-turn-helix domain-containing protein n=1 Tax=Zooshikella ganghwensis TaxID=202772 RepID=A0A4P9VMP0_9GAMM|nr:helix-turn-helix domain-containing protein [Zooshikella ganghwensis]RDH43192.1 helix-turn-helix domain-containing protein [Zooshikella ganghwensis]
MNNKTRSTFTSDFRLEVVRLVTEQNYSIREASEAMGVGKSTVDKWVRNYHQSQATR